MKKKILCLLSAVLLLLSLLPMTAWAAATVSAVELMISYPVHLAEPDFMVQTYGAGCKLDTSVNTDGYKNGVRWKKIFDGRILSATDTFVGAEMYELSVCLVADSGYSFSASETTVSVNTEEASCTLMDAAHIRANIQLLADNLYINSVTVTGLDAPAAGNTPDYSVAVQENNCFPVHSGYDTCKDGVSWYDTTDGKYIPIGTKFLPGHTCWAEVLLQANDGYEFPDNAQGYVNGQWIEASGSGERIALVVEFAPCGDHAHVISAWRTTQVYHYNVCTICGDMLEQEDHKGGTATCAEPGICTVCGYAYIEAHENHTPDTTKWVARAEMYHYHKCQICGAHCDIEDHRWSPKYHAVSDAGHAYQCADCKGYDILHPHTPGPEATATDPQVCLECGYILVPAQTHTHQLTLVAEVAPTCTEPGVNAYYSCSGCSERFRDAEGKEPYAAQEELIIPPQGHQISNGWGCDSQQHWRICAVCGAAMTETQMLHEMENGACTTCGYRPGAQTQPNTTQPVQTAPTAPDVPAENGSPKLDWVQTVGIGVACFMAALLATVLILKKKSKK